MDLAHKTAVSLMFVLFIACATARPPDLKKTFQDGSIELVVQKMQRPWRIVEREVNFEGFLLVSNQDDSIGLALYPEAKVNPAMAMLGALMFFTEKYPGSILDCVENVGQPASCRGNLVTVGGPPIRLEMRAWKVAGTETVAVVTGLLHDAADPSRPLDFEAVVAGIHSTKKKK